jgi:hypothetical protein
MHREQYYEYQNGDLPGTEYEAAIRTVQGKGLSF